MVELKKQKLGHGYYFLTINFYFLPINRTRCRRRNVRYIFLPVYR